MIFPSYLSTRKKIFFRLGILYDTSWNLLSTRAWLKRVKFECSRLIPNDLEELSDAFHLELFLLRRFAQVAKTTMKEDYLAYDGTGRSGSYSQ